MSITYLPSVDNVPQKGRSTPVAESQQSKDVSSFSSSTTSPWDSPENASQGLKPAQERARSAPITQPTEPIDPMNSPTTASPPNAPKSVDIFSLVSWSQSQWIAFGDSFAPPCRHGSGSSAAEVQRVQAGFGRSRRFLSEDSADALCKTTTAAVREDSSVCVSDVFSDRTVAAATTSKVFNGNSYADIPDMPCYAWGLKCSFLFGFAWKSKATCVLIFCLFFLFFLFCWCYFFFLPHNMQSWFWMFLG